jgi:hypothetical protein
MLAGGGPPLGFMLSGAMAASFGASAALVAGAAACAAFVVGIGLSRKELRDPDLGSIPAAAEGEQLSRIREPVVRA